MIALKVITFASLLCIHRVSALESAVRRRALEEDAVAEAPEPPKELSPKKEHGPGHGGSPGHGGKPMVPRTHVHGNETEHKHEWTYAQPNWGDQFDNCGAAAQSPINIRSADVTIGYKPTFQRGLKGKDPPSGLYQYMKYKALDGRKVINHGHNVQVNGEFGDFELPDGIYEVKQFHFHFPSEHKINGKHADGEMHIVHQKKNSSGTEDLAVVGLLLEEDFKIVGDNKDDINFFNQLGFAGDGLPKEGEEKPVKDKVDLNTFAMQFKGDYYHYFGSLTTPPCSETVHWYVMKTPAIVSTKAIEAFKEIFPKPANNRPVAPINGRKIIYSEVALAGEYGPDSKGFAESISEAARQFAFGPAPAEAPFPAPVPASAPAPGPAVPPGLQKSFATQPGIGSGMFLFCLLLLSLCHSW